MEAAVVAVAGEGRSTANLCHGRVVAAAVDVAAIVAEVEEGSVLVTRSEQGEEGSTVAEVAVAAEAVVDSVAAAGHELLGVLQVPVNSTSELM